MADNNSAFKYQKEKTVGSIFCQIFFSHIGLFIVVALYTVFGARMFIELELDAEEIRYKMKQYKAFEVDETINYTANLLWYYGDEQKHNWTYHSYNKTVTKDLKRLENFVLDAIKNNNYDGTKDGWIWDWTFMNSLLLCMTILTTIGYGNVTPVTFEGQVFCIAYSLIGVAIFLVFLANLGDSMAKGFTYLYSRCCCRSCRSRRYTEDVPDHASKRYAKHIIDDVVGEEEYMPTSKMFVPITINVVVLHLYFLFGGVLFAYWEEWDTIASIYFTFITLSTIGYGDYVPGNSLTDAPESMTTTMKLLVCITYIIFGMALLSMCVSLMQEQIVEKCHWFGRKVGLSGKDEVSAPKPVDKRKDSLMPLLQKSKGPSPFRKTDDITDIPEEPLPSPLPGILIAD